MSNRNAALGFIFVTLLIDVIGFGIIIPVVPNLISELGHVTIPEAAAYGGWLVASFSIMQFIFSPVLGNLSDQYGRRPVLLISLFGFGVDYLLTAFAPTIIWLFVGRTIAGIMGASFTTASAYIADVSTPEKRAQNFGMIGAAFGLGFIIGPALGGVIANYGLRAPFTAAAILTFINWLYGYFILPESLSRENRRKFEWKRANPVGSLRFFLRYKVILGLVASIILIYVAGHAVQSTWSYYTIEKYNWDVDMVGYSLAFVGLMVAIVQGWLIRFIIPKLGQERSVYVGLTLYAIGFLLFGIATQGWMMFAFLIPYCLGGMAGPSLQGIMSSQVPANQQGELQGALTSLISLTSIVGPLLMTWLFYHFSEPGAEIYFPGAAMIAGSILTIISAFLARLSLKKKIVRESNA
ncbi:TCR/Tet family MFS transporter [Chryseolinea sp. H1M3-3]|uniref:TCR/Tet family MFS transporter n=1 Tax=Chryseolinea sp. H1M3-3 TaxID=3034144 RepID=UPI0023EDD4DD|nr:TCR/Tet family MFS transporter [Chryseolinea sp. H1M3-3]